MVIAIAAEHRKGRRLYVATTQLDSRRAVVWDLGAIAERGTGSRQLIHDILLASCSVPGVFPPVPIDLELDGKPYTEMHVDGGVTAPVFVPPHVLQDAGPGANLYVIVAGKFFPEVARVQPRVLKVLSASGGALMHAHTRSDVSNLYHMAQLGGLNFHVVSLRQEFAAYVGICIVDIESAAQFLTLRCRFVPIAIHGSCAITTIRPRPVLTLC